jgi:hypothetical protein
MAYYIKKNGELEKIAGNVALAQADWNETDDRKITKIKNKPETLKTLDAVVENSNENALVGANAMKELTTTVAGMGSELIKTSAKVNLLANSDLGINVVEKGEDIHLNDSADSKLVEFAMYGKAVQNKTTGKNLLQYPFYEKASKTSNGITFTENKDGTITANGTATANATFIFQHRNDNKMLLGAGEYKVNGCPNGGSTSTYRLVTGKTSDSGTYEALITEYGSGGTFTLTKDTDIYIAFDVIKGTTVSNLMIRPMIRLASISDPTYEPYTGGVPSPNPEYPQDIEVAGESYNLLENKATSNTVNNIVYIVNADGSITANGTTVNSYADFLINTVTLPIGNYVMKPTGADWDCYFIVKSQDNSKLISNGGDGKFSLSNETTVNIYLTVGKDKTVNNLTVYPMLFKETLQNDRYMPYGKGSVEVKSVGKNLLPYPYYEKTKTMNNVVFTDNGDGAIKVNGTNDKSSEYAFFNIIAGLGSEGNSKKLSPNRYILSGCPAGGNVSTYRLMFTCKINGSWISKAIDYGKGQEFELTKDEIDNISESIINIRVYGTANNIIFKPMLRLASDTDSTYEPYKETISTIPTLNGLAGIPVDSGGNYTDSNGQQWICDEIVKYADGSGEYVQRIKNIVFDGSEDESWGKSGIASNISYYISKTTSGSFNAGDGELGLLCNRFQAFKTKDLVEKDTVGCSYGYAERGELRIGLGLSSEVNTVDLFRTWLSNNPVEMVYQLKNPSRTPLTPEQLAEIEKLSTFYPVTNISNDFDCGMKVKYIADNKAYVDKNLELQMKAQEQAMMSMFLLLPDEMQAAMISKDISNILLESEV